MSPYNHWSTPELSPTGSQVANPDHMLKWVEVYTTPFSWGFPEMGTPIAGCL
jgi:hypothetical protein